MEITSFFKRAKSKVINEYPYFKHDFLRYYSQELENGVVEFWAYPVKVGNGGWSRNYEGELKAYGTNGAFYLGKLEDEELTKPLNFYSLPMPLQRGAIRLYNEAGVYKA